MAKYAQQLYEVKNQDKYIGNKRPFMRSSWETVFATVCDNNPAIIKWASEPFKIPYVNPLTGKKTIYVPDFLIIYEDKNGTQHTEVIEIKPKKEVAMQFAKSKKDKAAVVVNAAKWEAARAWCKAQGIKFRIITEEDMFHQGSKNK